MQERTFVERLLAGEVNAAQIDEYVEYWHTHDTGSTLQEFLGMTDAELEEWGKSSDKFIEKLAERRKNN